MNRAKGSNGSAPELRDGESFPVLLPQELARMLGVTTQTLYLWRKQGIGPMFIRHTPKTIVYLRKTVDAWLEKQEGHKQTVYFKRKPRKRKRPKRAPRADRSPPSTESPGA